MQIEATLEQHRTPLSADVTRQRALTQNTAHRMAHMAVRQWEQAARGLLAIPSAVAMTTAAGAMLVTSVVERTFEVVEVAVAEIGRSFGSDLDAQGDRRPVVRPNDDRRNEAS